MRCDLRHRLFVATAALLTVVLAGCGRHDTSSHLFDPKVSESKDASVLIAEADSIRDFGLVISKPGRVLDHRFVLKNRTAHDLTIIADNFKPCCGTVSVDKVNLQPGEETGLVVHLSVGNRFGVVEHETGLRTDPPTGEWILRTVARAHLAMRVEQEGRDEAAYIAGGESRRVVFRVSSFGTPADPLIDLSRVDLSSSLTARWDEAAKEGDAERGLTAVSRRFSVDLDIKGDPGERKASILLRDGEATLHEHGVYWRVVPPITAAPEVVVLKPGVKQIRVLLTARDGLPFRLDRVDNTCSGIKATITGDAKLKNHSIVLDRDGTKADTGGKLIFHTDHPSQAEVIVTVVVLD